MGSSRKNFFPIRKPSWCLGHSGARNDDAARTGRPPGHCKP
jgi:hypothetical protein